MSASTACIHGSGPGEGAAPDAAVVAAGEPSFISLA